jgi:outer membrane protein OmpA-like peptidoglycan-associated protein
MLCSVMAANAQSVLINEEWAKMDKEAEVFFNEKTRQIAILNSHTGYIRVTYNPAGVWQKPVQSTRIAENLIGGLRATGIDGDSILFRSEEPGARRQWFAYNVETQMSRVRMKEVPPGMQATDNFGAVYRGAEESVWHWESFYVDTVGPVDAVLPEEALWQGYSGGKWLFVSPAPTGDTLKTLNFYDSDGTVTPFPYPINRGKPIRQAHWINEDSVLVVEEGEKDLSVRLYALVNQKLIKGDASRLKVGSYTLLYETWEDTIPTVVLDSVDVVEEVLERVIPNEATDKQARKLGLGNFAARFKTFTDPNQAYGFLSRLVNVLPGSYAADIDTGIVILGPRRTTYDEVRADSALLAKEAPELAPTGIIGFADQLKERNETVVSLYAMDRLTLAAVPFQLSFFNRTQDQMIFVDSARTGQVSFVYGHGDELGLTITAKGYAPKSIRINSKTDSLPTLYHQDILMDALAPLVRGLDGELAPESPSEAVDFQNILFDFDSAKPRKVSQPELKAMAELIKRSKASHVQIVGHTDDVGTDAYNKRLGQRRALAVCEALIRLGVSPNILEPVSKGESAPLVPNDTEFNRSLNRRVELGKH